MSLNIIICISDAADNILYKLSPTYTNFTVLLMMLYLSEACPTKAYQPLPTTLVAAAYKKGVSFPTDPLSEGYGGN